jgi:hypothetical protein
MTDVETDAVPVGQAREALLGVIGWATTELLRVNAADAPPAISIDVAASAAPLAELGALVLSAGQLQALRAYVDGTLTRIDRAFAEDATRYEADKHEALERAETNLRMVRDWLGCTGTGGGQGE